MGKPCTIYKYQVSLSAKQTAQWTPWPYTWFVTRRSVSKAEKASLRGALFGGMSRRELKCVVEQASRRLAPFSSFEDWFVL